MPARPHDFALIGIALTVLFALATVGNQGHGRQPDPPLTARALFRAAGFPALDTPGIPGAVPGQAQTGLTVTLFDSWRALALGLRPPSTTDDPLRPGRTPPGREVTAAG